MCTLLHYQAKVITLSEKKIYYIIRRCYYINRQLLHYRAVLLHYQAVITLTGDYFIIGCNKACSPESINTHLQNRKTAMDLTGCLLVCYFTSFTSEIVKVKQTLTIRWAGVARIWHTPFLCGVKCFMQVACKRNG